MREDGRAEEEEGAGRRLVPGRSSGLQEAVCRLGTVGPQATHPSPCAPAAAPGPERWVLSWAPPPLAGAADTAAAQKSPGWLWLHPAPLHRVPTRVRRALQPEGTSHSPTALARPEEVLLQERRSLCTGPSSCGLGHLHLLRRGEGCWFRTGSLEVREPGCSLTPRALGLWKVNKLLGGMQSWDPLSTGHF